MAIAKELMVILPHVDIQFASYSSGAEALRDGSWPVMDLDLVELPSYVSMLVESDKAIQSVQPEIIISHEEFAPLVAAHMAGKPCIYIADWLPLGPGVHADSLALAQSIIMIEDRGAFPHVTPLSCEPRYVGPVVREMQYERNDRQKARAELGIGSGTFVVTVVPGAFATEERAPIAGKLVEAFDSLQIEDKLLSWLTRTDAELIRSLSSSGHIEVITRCDCVEQRLVASDLVVTKGNRGTIIEAASLGIPSLSLTNHGNPVDERLCVNIKSNLTLTAAAVDAPLLRSYINPERVADYMKNCVPLGLHRNGARHAAKALSEELVRLSVCS